MKAIVIASMLAATVVEGRSASDLPVELALRSIDGEAVEVAVVNQTGRQLDISVSSAFVLGGSKSESFWAPFDPTTGAPYDMSVRVCPGKPIPPEPRPPRLTLAPRESHRLTIRLHHLKWAQRISSTWPDQQLDRVVSPGRYPLVWELSTYHDTTRLRSISVTVEVAQK